MQQQEEGQESEQEKKAQPRKQPKPGAVAMDLATNALFGFGQGTGFAYGRLHEIVQVAVVPTEPRQGCAITLVI